MAIKLRPVCVCDHDECRFEWIPRNPSKLPVHCPKCHRRTWNKSNDKRPKDNLLELRDYISEEW